MYQHIKHIAFDLDQTLYPKSPKIDDAIQSYIFDKIAAHKQCSKEEAKTLFRSYYPKLSGGKTLKKLGIPNASNIVQEALENADINVFLSPNPELITLLHTLKEKYTLALITGSNHPIAMQKVEKLQIPLTLFDTVITGEVCKSDGTAFKNWMQEQQAKDPTLKPHNFLSIGDRKSTDVDVPHSLGMRAMLVNVKEINKDIDVEQHHAVVNIRDTLL